MSCTHALLSLFLLSPCPGSGGGEEAVKAAVNNQARPATDLARDAGRRPEDVLAFLRIRPGMEVLDLFAGGGYYTEILNSLVGPDGKVWSHNNTAYLNFVGDEVVQRFADNRLANAEQLHAEVKDLNFESGSLDAVLMVLAYHDFFYADANWSWPQVDEHAFLENICEAMRPGGVLGVVDHIAEPGGEVGTVAQSLHRIEPQKVVADMTGSCFDLSDESFVLRNAGDQHTDPAIAPEWSGRTDRFVYRFIRR